jgi:hypothetical protein
MEILKRGFIVKYDVLEMGLIKPGGSGVIESTGYAYKASLKIKTSNIIQEENEELGLVDKEELIEFKIPCESNVEATELNKMFRILKANGVVVSFDGALPKYSDKSEYLQVTVLSSGTDLMKKYHDLMNVNKEIEKDLNKDTKTQSKA